MSRTAVTAVFVLALALSACSDAAEQTAPTPSAGTSGASATPSPPVPGASAGDTTAADDGEIGDLSAGLLPAGQFGPGAVATPLTEEALLQAQPGTFAENATVEPAECRPEQTPPAPDALAGQSVTTGTVTFGQILAEPADATSLDPEVVEDLYADCGTFSVTTEAGGQSLGVDVTLTGFDLPEVGDERYGFRLEGTSNIPGVGSTPFSTLFAVVSENDRSLVLSMTDLEGGALDPATFTDLVSAAYAYQAGALD